MCNMDNATEITAHQVTPAEPLRVFTVGKRGPGGAHHCYVMGTADGADLEVLQLVQFQDGHPAAVGHNGATLEAMLAVCMTRLQGFQSGPFPSRHNAEALQHIERALEALKDRTRERPPLRLMTDHPGSCRGCPDCQGIKPDPATEAALRAELASAAH